MTFLQTYQKNDKCFIINQSNNKTCIKYQEIIGKHLICTFHCANILTYKLGLE